MVVDWTKPIQFKNGGGCELVETNPEGWKQWGSRPDGAFPTRHIRRLGIDESSAGGAMSAHWYVFEDGASHAGSLGKELGFDIVNVAEG